MLFGGLLLCIILAPIFVNALSPSLNDDVLGLILFKADIQDPEGKLVSWNEDDDNPYNWVGIECNSISNRVFEVVLNGFKIQFLHKLSLANNNLIGSLSLNFAQLASQNSFSGPISADLFQQYGSLRSISLAKNKFVGPVPEILSSCSTLAYLNLSSNQFSGQLSSRIWSLNGFRTLDLSDNLLEGEIPNGIEGLNNLRLMTLRKNNFTGEIPKGIGGCLLLRSVDFEENSLLGMLPSTMQKLNLFTNLNFFIMAPQIIGHHQSYCLDVPCHHTNGDLTRFLDGMAVCERF